MIKMSLMKFISSVWSENDEELKDIEELNRLMEQLRKQETEVYFVSVQSNQ